MLAVVASQETWVLILAPLLGLALSVLVLYRFGLSGGAKTAAPQRYRRRASRWARAWRTFPPDVARSHLTADMVSFAGEEERFPWRLAPIRLLAIAATVGLGAPDGDRGACGLYWVARGAALGDPVAGGAVCFGRQPSRGRGGRRRADGNPAGGHRVHSRAGSTP